MTKTATEYAGPGSLANQPGMQASGRCGHRSQKPASASSPVCSGWGRDMISHLGLRLESLFEDKSRCVQCLRLRTPGLANTRKTRCSGRPDS